MPEAETKYCWEISRKPLNCFELKPTHYLTTENKNFDTCARKWKNCNKTRSYFTFFCLLICLQSFENGCVLGTVIEIENCCEYAKLVEIKTRLSQILNRITRGVFPEHLVAWKFDIQVNIFNRYMIIRKIYIGVRVRLYSF